MTQIIGPLPFDIENGQIVDANPVRANLQWILDQVNGNAAPITGPDFIQAGPGSVARSMQAKVRPISVSLEDKGGGVGIADNAAAIQACIDTLPATGGNIVFESAGIYKSSLITVPLSPKYIRFVGQGKEATILQPVAPGTGLIVSAGQVAGVGGARFDMIDMGLAPHASGSLTAIDMRNMSYCNFDIALIPVAAGVFAKVFDLFAQDAAGPGQSNCYFNKIRLRCAPNSVSSTVPASQIINDAGTSGDNAFYLEVTCVASNPTGNLVFIDSYCRDNVIGGKYEGAQMSGAGVVMNVSGYGNKIVYAYFENTGQPFSIAAEIESGDRQYVIVEKCAFASNTINGSTDAMVAGSTWRDNYPFGSDATVIAALDRLQKINKTESIAFNVTGLQTIKARTRWFNAQNFYYVMNDDGFGNAVAAEGGAGIALLSTGGGGQVAPLVAAAVAAGSPLSYVAPVFWQSGSGSYAPGYNGANAAQFCLKDSGTGRSINAAGTINASGADYAEYMRKAEGCGEILKGAICGVTAKGQLTDKFADAESGFVIKSTAPSYVGGDTWGAGLVGDELEAERACYDRIAFAGQVPIIVAGPFKPRDYIVPAQDGDGIKGVAVSHPSHDEYLSAVGRVVATEPDGRARVIVKVT